MDSGWEGIDTCSDRGETEHRSRETTARERASDERPWWRRKWGVASGNPSSGEGFCSLHSWSTCGPTRARRDSQPSASQAAQVGNARFLRFQQCRPDHYFCTIQTWLRALCRKPNRAGLHCWSLSKGQATHPITPYVIKLRMERVSPTCIRDGVSSTCQ